MATNHELAEQIISAYIRLRREGYGPFFTYGKMADAIGRAGQHRLLGRPLDIVREICAQRELPDIATMVVSKDSIGQTSPTPSKRALEKYSGWHDLMAEQARAKLWNW